MTFWKSYLRWSDCEYIQFFLHSFRRKTAFTNLPARKICSPRQNLKRWPIPGHEDHSHPEQIPVSKAASSSTFNKLLLGQNSNASSQQGAKSNQPYRRQVSCSTSTGMYKWWCSLDCTKYGFLVPLINYLNMQEEDSQFPVLGPGFLQDIAVFKGVLDSPPISRVLSEGQGDSLWLVVTPRGVII